VAGIWQTWLRRQSISHDLRRVAYGVASVVGLWSLGVSAVYQETAGPAVALTVVVGAVATVRFPRRRYVVAAAATGLLAWFTPDAVFLWPAVAAAMFLSIADDPARRPWLAWVVGLAGSCIGYVQFLYLPVTDNVLAFAGVAVGGLLGMLLRLGLRSEDLARETTTLRVRTQQSEEQARWLEQRTVLARELHDVVGHHVTAMVVQAEAGLVEDPTRALHSIGDLGRTALGELDALVVHLRDPDAPLALSAPPRLSDIEELLAAPLRQQGVEVEVRIDPGLVLDEALTLTVYRIAQETLTNIARHARATSAWVELGPASGRLRLRVTDNGVGPPVQISRGAGLLGIEERVRAAAGIWAISPRPGGGTVVDVFLPATG